MQVPYLTKCLKNKTIDQSDFCGYLCQGKEMKLENCYDENGNIIACEKCNK